MEIKNAKTLPKEPAEIKNGGLYIQRVRCGKPTCKCLRGEMHTGYYFMTRVGGKLTKTYVRKADAKDFAIIVRQAFQDRGKALQLRKTIRESLKAMNAKNKDLDTFIHRLKGGLKDEKNENQS